MADGIFKRCMVVDLHVGVWLGQRLDRDITDRVVREESAQSDALRVNKHLIPKAVLHPITSSGAAIRKHFHQRTIPWNDNGSRLLTRIGYQKFLQEHVVLRDTFRQAVDQFLSTDYDTARDQAAFRMGRAFKADDYPSVNELRPRFYANVEIAPVASSENFLVQLEDAETARIREDIDQRTTQRVEAARTDVWNRATGIIEHFATRLIADTGLRTSTIENIQKFAEVLPSLNVIGEPELDAVAEKLNALVEPLTADELRKDKQASERISGEARAILDEMKGFMGAIQ